MVNETQSRLKSYVKRNLISKGIKIVESSRHCYHIRFPLKGGLNEFNAFFNAFNIVVEASDKNCSSKYATYLLRLIHQIEDIPQGTTLDWVNSEISQSNTGSKIFATKALNPDTLGISDNLYTKEELIRVVGSSISNLYPKDIAAELLNLLEYACVKSKEIKIKKRLSFDTDDLAVISKDYGEVLAAVWIMSNLNFSKVYFPKKSNEKLIDFYAEKISICYPVSVKSGNGGKVLLQNIIDAIDKRKKLQQKNIKKQIGFKIIKIVQENSMKSQMIVLHKYLQTKMIADLSQIINKPIDDITLEYVMEWCSSKNSEELKTLLFKWWESYSMPKERTFSATDKERFIISPLGEKIKYILNENKDIKDSLTFLAKQIALLQINVDIKKDKLIFGKTFFKNSRFEFGWPGYSSGNKLGFRLVHK